jgi:hypothetical protein
MFHWCADYQRIWVTGPMRSGTSICARMICHDTGYTYVDGASINTLEANKLRKKFGDREGVVVQCPFAAYMIDKVVAGDDESLVVFMYRHPNDILASQKRIGWADQKELRRYPGATYETLTECKYAQWVCATREYVPNYVELEYEDLAPHPMWVPKALRRNWDKRQWRRRRE